MSSPVKILHLISDLGTGGAEVMLCNLLEAHAAAGFRSTLVTTSTSNDPGNVARAAAAGVTMHHLGCNALLKPGVLKRIRRIIREEKPDVIQTWMHKADLAGALAATGTGIPVVWGIHSLDLFVGEGSGRLKTGLLRTVLRFAAVTLAGRIVSCSQRAIEQHARRGYPQRRMELIPNGIDVQRFHPDPAARAALRRSLGIPDSAPVVGYMGRFAEVKDLPAFLRAAARVQQQRPETHFILCGRRDPLPDQLTSLIAAMPQPSHVHILASRQDTERVYPAFDVMALTSQSEAYPMVFIEAMACGIPCAATDTGDSDLIIGDPAAMAPVGDDAAIASTWLRLLGMDKDLRAVVSAGVRQRAEERFSVQACAAAYAGLYLHAARRSSPCEANADHPAVHLPAAVR